jgi:transcription elongation factor GreA
MDVSDDSHGEEKSYKIVGDLEADIKNNAISISSPLAKSLINKTVGDVVAVSLPRGEKYYEVKDIQFAD